MMQTNIPVRYIAYDWPARPGDPPDVFEEYNYLDLKLNVGLTDADFDPHNPAYNFYSNNAFPAMMLQLSDGLLTRVCVTSADQLLGDAARGIGRRCVRSRLPPIRPMVSNRCGSKFPSASNNASST